MRKPGIVVFWVGVLLAVIMGLIVSLDPGYVCQLDADNLPSTAWSYPALCFISWAFSVPLGFMVAAIGILIYANANRKTVLKFGLGMIGAYLFIVFANGPMPHVPVLFGIGGTLIMLFYFLVLWKNAARLKENVYKLAGHTFLVTGFWFTCGLGSRQYQPALGSGESPIDIMTYFVLAMFFLWLSESKTSKAS
jgi:hypothetical protein